MKGYGFGLGCGVLHVLCLVVHIQGGDPEDDGTIAIPE